MSTTSSGFIARHTDSRSGSQPPPRGLPSRRRLGRFPVNGTTESGPSPLSLRYCRCWAEVGRSRRCGSAWLPAVRVGAKDRTFVGPTEADPTRAPKALLGACCVGPADSGRSVAMVRSAHEAQFREEAAEVTSYRCVLATRRGGPEVLEVIERELRAPRPDEIRVRAQAASVSIVDVQARQGRGPFQQKATFVPGYAVVGQVDALGDEVAGFAPGDRVAVLTEINGYAEYVYVRRNPILRIPELVDAAAAVTLVLNYLVAYQVLHRRSLVQAGDRVLIVGAGGGIGTALCELGQLAGLVMYGVDSAAKHHVLTRYGVIPIDLRTDDLAAAVRRAEPNGFDAVFDGGGGRLRGHGSVRSEAWGRARRVCEPPEQAWAPAAASAKGGPAVGRRRSQIEAVWHQHLALRPTSAPAGLACTLHHVGRGSDFAGCRSHVPTQRSRRGERPAGRRHGDREPGTAAGAWRVARETLTTSSN